MKARKMHLVGYLCVSPTWHHNGSWRHSESDADMALDPARYEVIAQMLEHAKFDGIFIVDFLKIFGERASGKNQTILRGGSMAMLEPMQILATMARVTSRIGLSATMTTAFSHPYQIARAFATLDHISGGRAGWNIVTSASDQEARNFGMDKLLEKTLRYDHADEVVEACCELWNSWDKDAIVFDRKSGIYADPDKVRQVDYRGKMVRSQGSFTTPHSPQGSPVLMQAGSSERGRQFAARWGEIIFTLQSAKEDMQAFYSDIKSRVEGAGRRPDWCAILPSIDIVLGDTLSMAEDRAAFLDQYVSAELGVSDLGGVAGQDLSEYPLDSPLSELKGSHEAYQGILDTVKQHVSRYGSTLRDAGRAYAINNMVPRFVGTAERVADRLQEFFEAECCDGFVICPSLSPNSYLQFCKTVVPELQRRGIFRTEYEGTMFRDHLRS
jgi:FMN-dependent oxidoreductase (nitrilotriacetate monooxygenase family)